MSNQEKQSNRIRRIVGWGIIGLITIVAASVVLSYFTPRPVVEEEGFYYNNPFFLFRFGWVGGIILIFITFWLARWFLWPWRRRGDYFSYGYPHRDAESILKERYAKGEITKEQFEQIMCDLRKT
ncbi:MAG TPA: SHOCT domain-containing protein [Nitrososphaera sp.]|nr:SHOCT domain-containing protein [Nitrososphaera sp.]